MCVRELWISFVDKRRFYAMLLPWTMCNLETNKTKIKWKLAASKTYHIEHGSRKTITTTIDMTLTSTSWPFDCFTLSSLLRVFFLCSHLLYEYTFQPNSFRTPNLSFSSDSYILRIRSYTDKSTIKYAHHTDFICQMKSDKIWSFFLHISIMVAFAVSAYQAFFAFQSIHNSIIIFNYCSYNMPDCM